MNKIVTTLTRLVVVGLFAVAGAACEAEKSRNPLSPNVAGPIDGVQISTPTPVAPVNGSEVLNSQPLRLTFNNASTNGERPIWYVVELASDSGFANKLYANSRVNADSGAQTSVVVEGTLSAERTYFWRVKADDGANASQFSDTARFDLVVPVVLEAPVPQSPVGGVTTSNNSPTLTVTNGAVQGRAGRVEYWFEVALDAAFAQKVKQQPAERTGGATTSTVVSGLANNTLYYWRVAGYNGPVTGPWSTTATFRTPAVAPPPPPEPPGPPPPPTEGCSAPGSPANWSNEQWRVCFMSIVQARGVGPTVTQGALAATRADLLARGADWQNGWRGDYRPRIYLPVPGCPSAANPNAPDCSYNRAVDVGHYGEGWQWIVR